MLLAATQGDGAEELVAAGSQSWERLLRFPSNLRMLLCYSPSPQEGGLVFPLGCLNRSWLSRSSVCTERGGPASLCSLLLVLFLVWQLLPLECCRCAAPPGSARPRSGPVAHVLV